MSVLTARSLSRIIGLLLLVMVLACGEREKPGAPVAADPAQPASPAREVRDHYDARLASRMVPLLTEAVSFATYAANDEAHAAQKAWLESTATELGFAFRDAGSMMEITLPGPAGSSVLGLLVHGDVVEVDESKWSFPPFEATVSGGMIQGRGVADDKGPLVQALLAMRALADAGPARSATIRLLVGTNEESSGTDVVEYLAANPAPDFSLVLDSDFPLNIGEKAWNALYLYAPIGAPQHGGQSWIVEDLRAGLATSIVPDEAVAALLWVRGAPDWEPLVARLEVVSMPDGTSLEIEEDGARLTVTARGVSAHAGVSLGAGRNALVALAGALDGELPAGSPAHLLAFARMAGAAPDGRGLGIDQSDPLWGTYDVNVATIRPDESDPSRIRLAINIRRIPPWTGDDLESHLESVVDRFNLEHGASLAFGGWWDDEPLIIDPASPAVSRLLAIYERATGGSATAAVSSGGTYAKRTPRSIPFGMWFPGTPYPGHGVDEAVSIDALHRGTHVLIETLVDLVCSGEPFPAIVRQGAATDE